MTSTPKSSTKPRLSLAYCKRMKHFDTNEPAREARCYSCNAKVWWPLKLDEEINVLGKERAEDTKAVCDQCVHKLKGNVSVDIVGVDSRTFNTKARVDFMKSLMETFQQLKGGSK